MNSDEEVDYGSDEEIVHPKLELRIIEQAELIEQLQSDNERTKSELKKNVEYVEILLAEIDELKNDVQTMSDVILSKTVENKTQAGIIDGYKTSMQTYRHAVESCQDGTKTLVNQLKRAKKRIDNSQNFISRLKREREPTRFNKFNKRKK